MAGFLDTFFGSPEQTQALGLLGATMASGGGFGQGAANAMQYLSGADQRRLQRGLLEMQLEQRQMEMEQARRDRDVQQKFEQAARESFISPDRATAMSMGPNPDGSNMPFVQPGFDNRAFVQKAYGIDPFKAMDVEQKFKKSPITVAPGASIIDPTTYKPIYTAPDKDAMPSAVREYEYAKSQGYGGSFEQWQKDLKKAGASSTNVSVNTEKQFLGGLGEGLSKSIATAGDNARGALQTIGTVQRLRDALDTGKVIAGPGSSFRQFGLQVGDVLGVSGKDAKEKMLNTRQAIQSLAQLELDAAQQMKGQGQITEAERAIIRRAASGDIDGMTPDELRLLGGVLDRSARTKIRNYNAQVKPLLSNPNAAPLAPFLGVDEPQERAPVGVRRFNPATGRIE